MRGDTGMKVNLILQNANAPYNYYANTSATLTGAWQQFTEVDPESWTSGLSGKAAWRMKENPCREAARVTRQV